MKKPQPMAAKALLDVLKAVWPTCTRQPVETTLPRIADAARVHEPQVADWDLQMTSSTLGLLRDAGELDVLEVRAVESLVEGDAEVTFQVTDRAARRRRYVERCKAAGLLRTEVWLTPEQAEIAKEWHRQNQERTGLSEGRRS